MELFNQIKEKVTFLLLKKNIAKAGIFGSCTSNEFRKNGGVDILVELNLHPRQLNVIGIKFELENIVKC